MDVGRLSEDALIARCTKFLLKRVHLSGLALPGIVLPEAALGY